MAGYGLGWLSPRLWACLPADSPVLRWDTPFDFPLIPGRGDSQGADLAELLAPSSVLVMGLLHSFIHLFFCPLALCMCEIIIQAQNRWLIKM